MDMLKSLNAYKLVGACLVLCGVFGYLTVADEWRHTGEFLTVSGIFLAGIILLIVGFKLKVFEKLSLQWLAYCILISIAIGGIVLDNILLSLGFGIGIGLILAFFVGKNKDELAFTPGRNKLPNEL